MGDSDQYKARTRLEDAVWQCLDAELTEDEVMDTVADAVESHTEDEDS